MDCFFAAVEMRDDPLLRDIPMAVGGRPSQRGVLCTCNYAARKAGIRSAMASALALKICPELKIVSPNFEKYKEASKAINEIFQKFTNLVEPVSLDEAYLDVTGAAGFCSSATLMAQEIKKLIQAETGLTASAGVAPNKFLAKIASDWNKPDGIYTISPGQISSFMPALEVRKIPGVGSVTEKKMHKNGLFTCSDLQKKSWDDLISLFGKFGNVLYDFARGVDNSPVITSHIRKSLSLEKTYQHDLDNLDECILNLPELVDELLERIKKDKLKKNIKNKNTDYKMNKIFVKMKFNDFKKVTAEKGIAEQIFTASESRKLLLNHLSELLRTAFNRKKRPVRLLGVGVRFLESDNLQLSLF